MDPLSVEDEESSLFEHYYTTLKLILHNNLHSENHLQYQSAKLCNNLSIVWKSIFA